MCHTRDQHSHSHLNALTIGIPMTRRYNRSKIPRCRTEHEQELSILMEEDGEIFPHFCLTCEKEFIPHDHMFLFCSEDCRRIDQATIPAPAASACHHTTYNYPFYSALTPAPRDIIPQASPSRPTIGLPNSISAPLGIGSEKSTYNDTSAATGVQSVVAVLNLARKAALVFHAPKGGIVRHPYDGANGGTNVDKS
ncbi:hypothetical protein EDB81DRAFT_227053 [Dactylonectria macrodidyma]|uniref:Uncharacterized protein n=1 Tax=Dactylonectria macrodidyma TaxID=307937 RepID=A0A9P9IK42_9HYPO|nr:hypothetical protein EDB81DRAFT_227053 [Dactylonectria macrodidyma]